MDTTAAQNTADGYTISESGTFTFNTNCRVRSTPEMSDTGLATYDAGQSVNYTSKEKNDNHFWLIYTGDDGSTRYVPYANITKGTYFGTDSNSDDPIQASSGGDSGSTGGSGSGGDSGSGGNSGSTTTGQLGTLTGQDGANVADQTADGTLYTTTGNFTFSENAAGRANPVMSDSHVASFKSGDVVAYQAKEKNDGHYWLQYVSGSDGNTYFVPYATINPFRYYGTDDTPGDPVYDTSSSNSGSNGDNGGNSGSGGDSGSGGNSGTTTGSRPQGGTDTGTPTLSGATPQSTLDGYEFPMKGWVQMTDNGAQVRTQPTFDSTYNTDEKHPKGTDKLQYVAKVNGSDRMWVKLGDQRYLPIGKLSTLDNVTKMSKGGRYEKVGYVTDQNSAQPWEQIWPYAKQVKGTQTDKDWNPTGENVGPNASSWEENESITNETPDINFQPSGDELDALKSLNQQVTSGAHDDDVLIAYIADTHIDSYQTPASAHVLHSMMLMSYYAKNYGVDLMIHGGDLNDGTKPHDLSKVDVQLGVDAMKLGQRPYIILQGNHDDNSGYVRDQAGYQTDQLLTNDEAWSLRSGALARQDNPNGAVYGTYNVPNSNVTLVVLDGFDQPDVETQNTTKADGNVHFDSFRHGYSRYSNDQINWLKNTALPGIPSGNKVLFLNHIALGGINTWQNTWVGTEQKSEEEYEKKLFENNQGTNKLGYQENQQILSAITDYQSANKNVIGYLSGHTHADNSASYNGIQFVTQTCAIADRGDGSETNKNPQGLARSLNDLSNNAWSIIRISPSAKHVDQFRFGWKNDQYFLSEWDF